MSKKKWSTLRLFALFGTLLSTFLTLLFQEHWVTGEVGDIGGLIFCHFFPLLNPVLMIRPMWRKWKKQGLQLSSLLWWTRRRQQFHDIIFTFRRHSSDKIFKNVSPSGPLLRSRNKWGQGGENARGMSAEKGEILFIDVSIWRNSVLFSSEKKHQSPKIPQNCGFMNGVEALQKRKNVIRITTGSKEVDKILGGGLWPKEKKINFFFGTPKITGVETMSLTEVRVIQSHWPHWSDLQIYGESRCGKTQLAFTMMVACQLPVEEGVKRAQKSHSLIYFQRVAMAKSCSWVPQLFSSRPWLMLILTKRHRGHLSTRETSAYRWKIRAGWQCSAPYDNKSHPLHPLKCLFFLTQKISNSVALTTPINSFTWSRRRFQNWLSLTDLSECLSLTASPLFFEQISKAAENSQKDSRRYHAQTVQWHLLLSLSAWEDALHAD